GVEGWSRATVACFSGEDHWTAGAPPFRASAIDASSRARPACSPPGSDPDSTTAPAGHLLAPPCAGSSATPAGPAIPPDPCSLPADGRKLRADGGMDEVLREAGHAAGTQLDARRSGSIRPARRRALRWGARGAPAAQTAHKCARAAVTPPAPGGLRAR